MKHRLENGVNRNGYTDDTIAKRAQTNEPENGFQSCVTNKQEAKLSLG